jgi:hypothetical protein
MSSWKISGPGFDSRRLHQLTIQQRATTPKAPEKSGAFFYVPSERSTGNNDADAHVGWHLLRQDGNLLNIIKKTDAPKPLLM